MKNLMALIGVLATLPALSARAEGGCPPGQIPYSSAASGSAASMASCGPMPGGQTAIQQWDSRWGAVADDGNGVFGIVSDQRSERSAKKAAAAQCVERGGGSSCKATFTYRDQCAVVVGTDTGAISQGAATEEKAKALAMTKCEAEGSKECWVYYSGCSLPALVN